MLTFVAEGLDQMGLATLRCIFVDRHRNALKEAPQVSTPLLTHNSTEESHPGTVVQQKQIDFIRMNDNGFISNSIERENYDHAVKQHGRRHHIGLYLPFEADHRHPVAAQATDRILSYAGRPSVCSSAVLHLLPNNPLRVYLPAGKNADGTKAEFSTGIVIQPEKNVPGHVLDKKLQLIYKFVNAASVPISDTHRFPLPTNIFSSGWDAMSINKRLRKAGWTIDYCSAAEENGKRRYFWRAHSPEVKRHLVVLEYPMYGISSQLSLYIRFATRNLADLIHFRNRLEKLFH